MDAGHRLPANARHGRGGTSGPLEELTQRGDGRSPHTAQFTTSDALAAVMQQPHAYTADNPLNRSDPSGLCEWYAVVVCGVQAPQAWDLQR